MGISDRFKEFGPWKLTLWPGIASKRASGPGPVEKVRASAKFFAGRGFQKRARAFIAKLGGLADASNLDRHAPILELHRLKRFQLPVSQAGSFPSGCLTPGESSQVCLLRQGAALHSGNNTASRGVTLTNAPSVTNALQEALRPGGSMNYWNPKKRKWLPMIVKGTTTGPEVRPACADCESPPWEHCKCWPMRTHSERNANALPTHTDPTASDRFNQEADERLQLALWDLAA